MNRAVLEIEVFQAMHREHGVVRERLSLIHDVFTEVGPSAAETMGSLNEFREALVVHLCHEMEDGFVDDVTAYSPPLGREASKHCTEHEVLQKEPKGLYRFATSGSPSMP